MGLSAFTGGVEANPAGEEDARAAEVERLRVSAERFERHLFGVEAAADDRARANERSDKEIRGRRPKPLAMIRHQRSTLEVF